MTFISKNILFLGCLMVSNAVHAGTLEVCDSKLKTLLDAPGGTASKISGFGKLEPECGQFGIFYFQKASFLDDTGDVQSAVAVLEKALQNKAVNRRFENAVLLGSLWVKEGRIDEALAMGADLEKYAPLHPGTLLLLADANFRKSNFSAAKKYSALALKQEPFDVVFPIYVQSSYMTGSYKDAVSGYEEGLKHPEAARLMIEQGQAIVAAAYACYELADYQRAAELLELRVSRVPTRSANINQLIEMLSKKGFWKKK